MDQNITFLQIGNIVAKESAGNGQSPEEMLDLLQEGEKRQQELKAEVKELRAGI